MSQQGLPAGGRRTYTWQQSHCSRRFSLVSSSDEQMSQRGRPPCWVPRTMPLQPGLAPALSGEASCAAAGGSARTPSGSCCSAASTASLWRCSSALWVTCETQSRPHLMAANLGSSTNTPSGSRNSGSALCASTTPRSWLRRGWCRWKQVRHHVQQGLHRRTWQTGQAANYEERAA